MTAWAQLYALYSHRARSFNQWQRALYPNFIIKYSYDPLWMQFSLSYSWEYGSSFNPHISVCHLKNIKKLAAEYNHVWNNFPHSLSIMIDVYQYHAVMKWISTPLDSVELKQELLFLLLINNYLTIEKKIKTCFCEKLKYNRTCSWSPTGNSGVTAQCTLTAMTGVKRFKRRVSS